MATKKKTSPSWIDVKAKLIDFDRTAVLDLLRDLYVANKDNQAFLHARLLPGDDALKPYKVIIERWLWPDLSRNQDISLAEAKKAIADYKKAAGMADGLVELMVFYCEKAAGFSNEVGLDDGNYHAALLGMFEQALNAIAVLPPAQRPALRSRLDAVRQACHDIGHGVGDGMAGLLAVQPDNDRAHAPCAASSDVLPPTCPVPPATSARPSSPSTPDGTRSSRARRDP